MSEALGGYLGLFSNVSATIPFHFIPHGRDERMLMMHARSSPPSYLSCVVSYWHFEHTGWVIWIFRTGFLSSTIAERREHYLAKALSGLILLMFFRRHAQHGIYPLDTCSNIQFQDAASRNYESMATWGFGGEVGYESLLR